MSRSAIDRARARDNEALRRLAEFAPDCDMSVLAEYIRDTRTVYGVLGADPYATTDEHDEPDEADEDDDALEDPMTTPHPMETSELTRGPIEPATHRTIRFHGTEDER